MSKKKYQFIIPCMECRQDIIVNMMKSTVEQNHHENCSLAYDDDIVMLCSIIQQFLKSNKIGNPVIRIKDSRVIIVHSSKHGVPEEFQNIAIKETGETWNKCFPTKIKYSIGMEHLSELKSQLTLFVLGS